jgi:hypothetical protein
MSYPRGQAKPCGVCRGGVLRKASGGSALRLGILPEADVHFHLVELRDGVILFQGWAFVQPCGAGEMASQDAKEPHRHGGPTD